MGTERNSGILVRPAIAQDAEGILAVLREISAQRTFTAIDKPWSVEAQRRYLSSLSPREAVHVAETTAGVIVGYQALDLWAPTLNSMSHVGQIGTFIGQEWRRRGIGYTLFWATLRFARGVGFRKFIIQVRSANIDAQNFYKRLGFCECGRLSRQVRIGDTADDEILMEFFT